MTQHRERDIVTASQLRRLTSWSVEPGFEHRSVHLKTLTCLPEELLQLCDSNSLEDLRWCSVLENFCHRLTVITSIRHYSEGGLA